MVRLLTVPHTPTGVRLALGAMPLVHHDDDFYVQAPRRDRAGGTTHGWRMRPFDE